MNVYIGTSGELKNAYIGEVWTPGSNTIAYFPLENDQLDKTGNYSLDTTGTKQTIGYSFTGLTMFVYSGTQRAERFISYWVKPTSSTNGQLGQINVGNMRFGWNTTAGERKFVLKTSGGSFIDSGNLGSYSVDTWYFFAYGIDNSNNYKAYINAVQKWSGTATPALANASALIGGTGNAIFSDLIIEDRLWTAEEISHYYNQTKSNYGL